MPPPMTATLRDLAEVVVDDILFCEGRVDWSSRKGGEASEVESGAVYTGVEIWKALGYRGR